jgi:hypothetical protein
VPGLVFRILPGLPTSGPNARPYPADFGRTGKEGFVVEFLPDTPNAWTGNFRPGLGGFCGALPHPNSGDVVVFANGDGYILDPRSGELRSEMFVGVSHAREAADPPGFILDRQQLAFTRIAPIDATWRTIWHTRRLSWDGFKDVVFDGGSITGLAWSPHGAPDWKPFTVDLATGRSTGGAYDGPAEPGWEELAGPQ